MSFASPRDAKGSSTALGHEQTGLRGKPTLHDLACKIVIESDPDSRKKFNLPQSTAGTGIPTSEHLFRPGAMLTEHCCITADEIYHLATADVRNYYLPSTFVKHGYFSSLHRYANLTGRCYGIHA